MLAQPERYRTQGIKYFLDRKHKALALRELFLRNRFLFFFTFFFFWPCQKFPGQALNPCHSRDPSVSSDNAESLTAKATRELLLETDF